MAMLVSINGELVDPAAATVSIFDRGFLFGDAIYEVTRTVHRRPFHLDLHLDRLERSGDAIELDVRPLRAPLVAEIDRLIAALPDERDLVVRIMVTRGQSPGLDLFAAEGPPLWILWVKTLDGFRPELYERGLRILSVSPDEIVARVSPGVKSNNRQANVMVHRHARQEGYDDGLFVDPSGVVTEGPTWNLFVVKSGQVITPPLERGVLEGITRGLVLRLCARLDVPAHVREITLDEARAADELFITSTTRGVMPVRELDQVELPGAPGPVTRRLRQALVESMENGG
ncbi:MAG: aminotransferase class IV [Planctomycetes bacterium]|nr:aminotransferase class IV [Planctomycetota bacterium]